MSIPDGSHIPIEQRPSIEACLVRGAVYPKRDNADGETEMAQVMVTPEGVVAWNPAFDVTPAKFISAVVTEKAVSVAPFEPALRKQC